MGNLSKEMLKERAKMLRFLNENKGLQTVVFDTKNTFVLNSLVKSGLVQIFPESSRAQITKKGAFAQRTYPV